MKQFILSAAALCLLGLPSVRGQSIWPSTINAAGGSATLSGYTFEWSIAEMTLVNTASTSALVVTQGLLQPTTTVTGVADHSIMQFVSVYPNPASSTLNINFNSPQKAVLSMRLMDVTGKVLQEKSMDVKMGMNTGQVDMSSYAAATYMLQVWLTDGDNTLGSTSYKVQKVQ